MTETGPCLVEMNCRTHGGDGAWVPLARGLTGGYSQVRCVGARCCCVCRLAASACGLALQAACAHTAALLRARTPSPLPAQQVDATIDCFIPSPAAFDKLPVRPPHPFRAAGQEVLLVSTEDGKVIPAAPCARPALRGCAAGALRAGRARRAVDAPLDLCPSAWLPCARCLEGWRRLRAVLRSTAAVLLPLHRSWARPASRPSSSCAPS